MTINENNFIDRFTPKTPKQVQKEISLKERKQKQLEQLNYLEAMKPLTLLKEDLKNATDRFFNLHPKTQYKKTIELEQPIEKKHLLEQLKVSDPLVVIDGNITLDNNKLLNLISSQTETIVQNTFDKINNSSNIAQMSLAGDGGGGGVDVSLNGDKLIRNPSTINFVGDNITLTKRRKNIDVSIAGAPVIAQDPTIDFARESTTLSMLQSLSSLTQTVNSLVGVIVPLSYPNGIGGTAGNWITM
jgi:hypothetical protein